jgi:MoxR-like ATPase
VSEASDRCDPRDPRSIDEIQEGLRRLRYLAGRELATSIFLALKLGRPLLLEGEAGTGKTEVAKALAALLGRRLIRLQCYEGLDVHSALYEWDYSRQLLHVRLVEAAAGGTADRAALEREIFSRDFLLRRPLLEAIDPPRDPAGGEPGPAPVLLIDELDRADEEFEAFLLELLSDFQVTIPEIGTIRAPRPPLVVVTSNRTRELHDALRRRCLYLWLDFPTAEREYEIVATKVPGASAELARQVVGFVQALRREDLYKPPGVAETLDWTAALVALDQRALTVEAVEATLGALLKYQDDVAQVRGGVAERLLATAPPA